jgi:hypothetical protein
VPPPLHFDTWDTGVCRVSVLRSFNEQKDWLDSLETADPLELFVLVPLSLQPMTVATPGFGLDKLSRSTLTGVRGLSIAPFRVLGPIRGEFDLSPDRLLPSCSWRVLRSLSWRVVAPYWLSAPSLTFCSFEVAFEVFPHVLCSQRHEASFCILPWTSFCSRV